MSAAAPLSPENEAPLAALERMLRRAGGFRLAFAVSNHPDLRERLAERVRADLPDRRIADVVLEPGRSAGVVDAIAAAAAEGPDAVFVHGLDALDPHDARARARASTSAATSCGGR